MGTPTPTPGIPPFASPWMQVTAGPGRLEWQRKFVVQAGAGGLIAMVVGAIFVAMPGSMAFQSWGHVLTGQWLELIPALFFLPFLAAGLAAIGFGLMGLSGGEQLRLADGELVVEWTLAGWVVWRRRLPADEIEDVQVPRPRVRSSDDDEDSGGAAGSGGLRVIGRNGQRLTCAIAIPRNELRWLATCLRNALQLPADEPGAGRYHPDAPPATEPDPRVIAAGLGKRITLPDTDDGDTLVQLRAGRPGCVILFLALWVTIWSAATLAAWREVILDGAAAGNWLAAAALTAFLLVALVALANLAFSRVRLRIGRFALVKESDGFGWWRAVNTVHAADVARIELDGDTLDPDEPATNAVRVRTRGGTVTPLAAHDSREFRAALAALLRQWHRAHGAPEPDTPLESSAPESNGPTPIVGDPGDVSGRLVVDGGPGRAMLQREVQPGLVRIDWRYRHKPAQLLGGLMVTVFWNGIVGLFLLQLAHRFEWFVALFLVPFVLIGTALLVMLLFPLIPGCFRYRLRVNSDSAEQTWRVLGVPLRVRQPMPAPEELDRVSLELAQAAITPSRNPAMRWQVVLRAANGRLLADIRRMSEAEARAVADALRVAFPKWPAVEFRAPDANTRA